MTSLADRLKAMGVEVGHRRPARASAAGYSRSRARHRDRGSREGGADAAGRGLCQRDGVSGGTSPGPRRGAIGLLPQDRVSVGARGARGRAGPRRLCLPGHRDHRPGRRHRHLRLPGGHRPPPGGRLPADPVLYARPSRGAGPAAPGGRSAAPLRGPGHLQRQGLRRAAAEHPLTLHRMPPSRCRSPTWTCCPWRAGCGATGSKPRAQVH